ncbi:MAG: phosphomevalonate kinase [Furfurilactobacillus sp.]|uniref:phosphomevalonate kinase n=2 Tax=Furfurilactobacillus TaxID=2767882 RepID=A0A6N9I317_9LACO|nr:MULTISPECIES: phosphomevalonate kinase [Furfurilactobacillus]QLE66614.1 Phosphomevalonate kinase [Furfurilactobacillus rossiae]MCF6160065.1 phosphomevalonate kinase [Furfurilactobacillus milii]MCF6162386.1 phosphomevalonate kinase [Furfurilactobacillus milii]MCF6419906.1 phosphomevalonate kinase [Furfurilactobacillus milii]MCH4010681.1 phosphomevalonate kinase [Furfurilactobacillus sp.]
MISVKAPGKLYIAGEYAVVEAGFPAIIVALNQFVTVTIEESKNFGTIESEQYKETSVNWRRAGDELVFDNRDNPFHYLLSAIRLTESYARACGRELKFYHLSVNSQLDSKDGKKFGLGSSAAVTVGTVKALCKFYQLPITKDTLFKLAAIAHLDVQGNGSLGDIAASVYGGWIAYHSFDHQWLTAKRDDLPLIDLLALDWPGLSVELLTPPADLRLLIGWTGSPASTSHLVDKVTWAKSMDQLEYRTFLQSSRDCLNRMIQGFRDGAIDIIQRELRLNRKLLQHLSAFSHVPIETVALNSLCAIAEDHGGAAKTSGAGGGDCGIVLIDRHEAVDTLLQDWETQGITTLPLSVHNVMDLV